jgi:phosphoglycolate phosphatase
MPKLLIFDMDGVIFDSVGAIMEYQMYKYPTVTREELLENLKGGEDSPLANHTRIKRSEEQKALDQQRYLDAKMQSIVFPGMRELLSHMHRQGYTIVLNTNAYMKNTDPLLKKAGIFELFDMVATRDLHDKKSEKFQLIDQHYSAGTADTLFITDTIGDIREAAKAHIPTIAVTWGAHTREHFEGESFDNLIDIVDSVEELQQRIEGTLTL